MPVISWVAGQVPERRGGFSERGDEMRFTGGEWIVKVMAALEAHAKPPVWRHGGQAPAKVPWMP